MRKYIEILEVNEKISNSDLKYALKDKLKKEGCTLANDMLPYVEAYVVLSNPREKTKYLSMNDEEYSFEDRHPSVKKPETVAYDIEYQLKKYNNQIDNKWTPAIIGFIVSLATMLAGIGITFISYNSTEPGGSFTIFYGLIVVGLFATVKNFFGILAVREEKRNAPEKMWMYVDL